MWPMILLWLTLALTVAQAISAWLFLNPFPTYTNRISITAEKIKLILWFTVCILALIQFQRQPNDTHLIV